MKMEDVFHSPGSVTQKMIAEMAVMKETLVTKKLVLIINLLVLEVVIAYLKVGFAVSLIFNTSLLLKI